MSSTVDLMRPIVQQPPDSFRARTRRGVCHGCSLWTRSTPVGEPTEGRDRNPRLPTLLASAAAFESWKNGSMARRPAFKFDPALADRLDDPQRDAYLPADRLVGELGLRGGETVIDYGAGTGRLTLPLAAAVGETGRVLAVDESEPMLERLRAAVADLPTVEPLLITTNDVPAADGSVAGVLAVNLLHEVRGEGALREMRRLLAPTGRLVVADWRRGAVGRPAGPPDEQLYDAAEATAEVRRAGFEVAETDPLPYHYVLMATAPAE
jgi:SAM-dependent methyltransferase